MANLELKSSTGFDIKTLRAMDDAQLLDILGLVNTLNDFKEDLEEADKLSGKAREEVQERINNMLSPRIYPGDLGYAIEDAQRRAKKNQSGKDAMADESPSSVID
jgi:hypothetical protein